MLNIWKILKFDIPQELEEFKEQQEKIIEKTLKHKRYSYKFIINNWVFLCDDEISEEEVKQIKNEFIYLLKSMFKEEMKKLEVKKYATPENTLFKFIFPTGSAIVLSVKYHFLPLPSYILSTSCLHPVYIYTYQESIQVAS